MRGTVIRSGTSPALDDGEDAHDGSSQFFEFSGDPIRVPAKIQHGSNENLVAADLVVNAIRKAFGKEAVKTSEVDGMNSGE
jgi:hypothetical protein